MTIEIVVRTASAVIFAADSKLTTNSFVGIDRKGNPEFLTQTYDNAVKLGHDQDKTFIAAVAGNGSLGTASVIDYLSQREGGRRVRTDSDQIQYFWNLFLQMGKVRFDFWSRFKISVERWPATIVMVAAISPQDSQPRIWRVAYERDSCEVTELLSHPGVFLEGAFFEVFSLLYGYHPEVTSQVIKLNKRRYKSLEEDFEDPSVLKPIRRLNVAAMPIQDAMDLAYFLAGVQIEMDRFLPGTPKCGGSVDLTVLLGTPFRDIKEFPGKLLVHPKQGAVYK